MTPMPEFLTIVWLSKPLWVWLGFFLIVVTLLALDLGVMHKTAREVSIKESIRGCAFYTTLGLLFSVVVYWLYMNQAADTMIDPHLRLDDPEQRGWQAAQLYLTGYLIELSLSMDNVFVIALIFGFFKIPQRYQHRVLFWGILGVVFFRAIMIGVGAALIAEFHWIMLVFGVFLLYAGIKMFKAGDGHEVDIAHNPILKFVRKHFPVTEELHGEKFFIRQRDATTNKMVTYMTPTFIALLMVEFADIIFAVDSVPAIFAVTLDPYIVYTSNIFAILGLRSLYFTLAAMVDRFKYLKYALALILIMIGVKILFAEGADIHFPNWMSLLATVGFLIGGVIYSLYRTRQPDDAAVP
jgi:tellurite resistance protein TerC